MLRAHSLHTQFVRLRRPCPLQAGGVLLRRRVSCSASPTPGQKLRGHGKGGWKEAGWDYSSPTKLDPELREMLMNYGQLTHATYDRLGTNPCQPTWGYNTVPAHQIIEYLTQDYPLAPNVETNAATPAGTNHIYALPTSDNLSPMIYSCPGGDDPAAADAKATYRKSINGIIDDWIDRLFVDITSLPIALLGGSRPLFDPDPATGRKLVSRPTFMGFVAASQPTGPEKEVDVVFVWRGTIFKEEWAANLGEDMLFNCTWEAFTSGDGKKSKDIAQPWQVGVHEGFQDLYLRRAVQPLPKSEAVPAERHTDGTGLMAPAEVVRKWMAELMATHNVTTFTTTGHSLGGALSTVSAFDIARELEALWAATNDQTRATWATKAKPKVSAIPFAPPRVGNWTFSRAFHDTLDVQELRICNVNDLVPKVPGVWVQILTSVCDRLGITVYKDANSTAAKVFGWLYYGVSYLSAKVFKWPSRWGYFHVGTILEVDSDKDFDGVGVTPDAGTRHHLEGLLAVATIPVAFRHGPFSFIPPWSLSHPELLSKKGTKDGKTDRNPLLLNKSNDILKTRTCRHGTPS